MAWSAPFSPGCGDDLWRGGLHPCRFRRSASTSAGPAFSLSALMRAAGFRSARCWRRGLQGRNTAEPQPRIHGELRTFGLDVSERSVVHLNVTEHPTAEWKTQQIVDAFPDDTAPRWLRRDSDTI